MQVKQEMDRFVKEHGTGWEIHNGDGTIRTTLMDNNIWLKIVELLYAQDGHEAEWISLIRKKLKGGGDDNWALDIREIFWDYEFVKKVCSRYDKDRGKGFSNYFLERVAWKYINEAKRRLREIPTDKLTGAERTDDRDSGNGTGGAFFESRREIVESEINEILIENLSIIVSLLNAIKSKKTKYKMFRMFYTNSYITAYRTIKEFDMKEVRHSQDNEGNLDKELIKVVFREMPQNDEEYTDFETKTIRELEAYYDTCDDSRKAGLKKAYGGIFTDAMKNRASFHEPIPFPIDPQSVYVAYLFIRDNAGGRGVKLPYSQAFVSKYKNQYEETIGRFRETPSSAFTWEI